MNRDGKRICGRDGFEYPHTPRARRGLVPGIFARDRRGPPQLGRERGMGVTRDSRLGSPNFPDGFCRIEPETDWMFRYALPRISDFSHVEC